MEEQKIKFDINKQIVHMKEKGVLFNITTEEVAKIFLEENNYYFKLKSYSKNYEKYESGKNKGKYINLEFAYIQELSRMDMLFRKFIMKITLDIEHFAKVKLIKDCSSNKIEDGYEIVKQFCEKNLYILSSIEKKSQANNSACADLIKKYGDNYPIWILVEIISFGDFIKLNSFYYKKYPDKNSLENCLGSVKFLRNAAAHNNCLLNTLRTPYAKIVKNKDINTYISKISSIKKEERKKKLTNPIINDFVVTLYVFNNIVKSKESKKIVFEELKELIDSRFTENKEYFSKNQLLVTHYRFVKKIVDHFYKISI